MEIVRENQRSANDHFTIFLGKGHCFALVSRLGEELPSRGCNTSLSLSLSLDVPGIGPFYLLNMYTGVHILSKYGRGCFTSNIMV